MPPVKVNLLRCSYHAPIIYLFRPFSFANLAILSPHIARKDTKTEKFFYTLFTFRKKNAILI